MKVNHSQPPMVNSPSVGAQGPSSPNDALLDKIMHAERAPVQAMQKRRAELDESRNELSSLNAMMQDLGSAADGMRTPSSFTKLKAESTHPDIMDAKVTGSTRPGSYEFEVNGLARPQKLVEAGFPDPDQTSVGFGFMGIEGENGNVTEVRIEPGSSLNDVATAINSSGTDVRAQVINTGSGDEPFRLLVSNVKTGAEAKIHLDPDTTHLNFEQSSAARDLSVKFEGVDVARSGNQVNDLVEGLALDTKRAEPGTKVRVDVRPDVDTTFGGIQQFVDKYNKVAGFANQQLAKKPEDGPPGQNNSALRSAMRGLQSQLSSPLGADGAKYRSLADIGITTNARTGELMMNESKVKEALSNDYEAVRDIFASSEKGDGLAARLGKTVKNLQDPTSGSLRQRQKTLDHQIRDQDQRIEVRTKGLEQREIHIRDQLQKMQANVEKLNGQQAQIAARIGGNQ